ncbi:uncharacterized protein F4812DRAFT_315757 [Daldinia caldariorum]|uniref:uncharacterized protein n=1 Tax=Daldinia caldariorum TaxID=326644 RepID=UPI0020088E3F|nr:uncharacterized protein F4812DRAFT_315757 [Daldinia caldariorum]KAI1470146.1 hypothetical protein F4812DRAFT_315757 [Daldinia caldariorum]
MASGSSLPLPHKVPKLGHKKSMFGCQRCRARRVKCNEQKPICYNCKRHDLPCIYDRDASAKAFEKSTLAQSPPYKSEESDPPESRTRRMTETRLMHQYIIETGESLAIDLHTRDLLSRIVPKYALNSDALLYSMYALSALHLAKLGRGEEIVGGAENAANMYYSMAVREHKEELSNVNRETADAVCLTSCLIRAVALLQLEGRSLQPYTPPWQCFALIQASTSTFVEVVKRMGPDPQSPVFQLIKDTRNIHNNGKPPDIRDYDRLRHLMNRPDEIRALEPWDEDIQAAYEVTLAYLCTIFDLIDEQAPPTAILRRLIMFPMLARRRFVELIQEGASRSLVILAHYFALLTKFEHIWWVASVGADELRAIAGVLPDIWQGLLAWPLKAIETKELQC